MSYRARALDSHDGHMGCRVRPMQHPIALIALVLLGALLGSVWLRRAELEFSGESATMLLGLAVCVGCVLLILFATG